MQENRRWYESNKQRKVNSLRIMCVVVWDSCGGTTANRIDLTRRTLTIDVSNGSVEDVLIVLATEHRVPIGFERSGLYQKQITVQLVRVSLKTVLDSIIAQAPVYRWELKDGVINFVPRIGRDPFLQTLLSTRVTRYRPLKGTNKF